MKFEVLSAVECLHIYKYLIIKIKGTSLEFGKLIKYKNIIYRCEYTSYKYATESI